MLPTQEVSTWDSMLDLHGENQAGMGSNGVTIMKFLQLLMILELYLELSYFLSQILLVVIVTEVTKVP